MARPTLSLVFALAVLLFASTSHAARYTVLMSGPNENPVNSSPGVGSGLVDIDTVAHTLTVNVVFNGLTGTTTASHIHCCITQPNGTAGVATATPTFPNFPLGVTGGTYNRTFDLTQAASWNAAFITANGGTPASAEAALAAGAAAGQAYFNIHTSTFGGGEIRGFLVLETTREVPTLQEWALIALAGVLSLVGFVTLRRRMR